MKRTVSFVVVLLLFLTGCASGGYSDGRSGGRSGGRPQAMEPPSAEDQLAELQSVLTLNPGQVEKIRPVIEEHHAEMEAMFERARKGGRSAMMELRDEIKLQHDILRDALEQFLTPEQMQKYDQFMKEKELEHQQQGPGGGGPGGGRGRM